MINKKEWERMISGELYHPYSVGVNTFEKVHLAQKKFNESEFWHDKTAFEELKKCFKVAPDDMVLTPPVYFDHGDKISFGKNFYANTDLTILDENYVTFGNNIFIAPHVSIYTAGHPIDKDVRNKDLEYARPVTIGDNVWICGNVVINPGVTIGDNTVIGSGSVVVKDIPSNVIAVGNPCRVIREIIDEDRKIWNEQLNDYLEDVGRSNI
ncbi:MAG: sugar O-acetyltransferase [Anaerococcus sp.]|uniref:sugar O-acetyltransferase n=1 Tax=Anaerococcus sp. TaxID=1872515 RepID=UPI0029020F26|nr:sugar O-acetyltransferase [Anaerococcus sp.]MDU2354242.1 sugar O-acetyltransferase [Anaerococcus sp.]